MSSTHYLHCEVPDGLKQVIKQQSQTTGQTFNEIVEGIMAVFTGQP